METPEPAWKSLLGISAHIKDETIEEVAAVARRWGARYLEVVAERFWDLPDAGGEARWRELKELVAGHGFRPTVHASYLELNLASLNPHLREAAVRQTLRCLELAAYLEAEFLVVHAGNLNRNYSATLLPEARSCLHESLATLAAEAEASGVAVVVENGWNGENHPLITNGADHAAVVEEVGSGALQALFDVGHAHTFGVDLAEHLQRLQPHLAGIHLHDNAGRFDEHLPLGKGTIEQAAVQRCFEAGVPVILEMNALADIDASIAYLEAALEGGQPT
ncbi:MAG: sugar phosphate isomerase/epimerase family protein [bacterium]